MSDTLSLDDLREIMVQATGEDEDIDLSQDIGNVSFTELGFDSLALLELVTLVKRRTGVVIEDDELDAIATPNDLLDKVATDLEAAA